MAALTAVLDLRAAPFAGASWRGRWNYLLMAAMLQVQWAARAALEQQIAAGTRAGTSTAAWTAELLETNLALKEMAAANQIVTPVIKKHEQRLCWRELPENQVGRELLVASRKLVRNPVSSIGPVSIIIQSSEALHRSFRLDNWAWHRRRGGRPCGDAMRKVNLEAQEEYSIPGRLKNLREYQARAMQSASERAREFAHWL